MAKHDLKVELSRCAVLLIDQGKAKGHMCYMTVKIRMYQSDQRHLHDGIICKMA